MFHASAVTRATDVSLFVPSRMSFCFYLFSSVCLVYRRNEASLIAFSRSSSFLFITLCLPFFFLVILARSRKCVCVKFFVHLVHARMYATHSFRKELTNFLPCRCAMQRLAKSISWYLYGGVSCYCLQRFLVDFLWIRSEHNELFRNGDVIILDVWNRLTLNRYQMSRQVGRAFVLSLFRSR